MYIRRLIALVLLFGLPNIAFGQSQQQPAPAPAFHPGTGITMPVNIGVAKQTRTVDYGKTYGQPGLGYSWSYLVPQTLSATVYIYHLGKTSIPSGAANPLVLQQFDQASGDIVNSKKYAQITPIKGPTNCVVGSVTFRCVTETAVVASNNLHEKLGLLVTGYRNHVLKIRLDWVQGSPPGDAAADNFVQILVSQVLK